MQKPWTIATPNTAISGALDISDLSEENVKVDPLDGEVAYL